jgi:hypothetical protein
VRADRSNDDPVDACAAPVHATSKFEPHTVSTQVSNFSAASRHFSISSAFARACSCGTLRLQLPLAIYAVHCNCDWIVHAVELVIAIAFSSRKNWN